jgi:ribosome-binding protein aMBF1 (putative translation factor)
MSSIVVSEPAACRPILVDFADAGSNSSSPFSPGLTFGSYRTSESRRLISGSKTKALNQPRTIVPQSFSVKRQLWGVPKQIGADKRRESRTLGEAVGAEITRLRIDRGWSQSKLAHDLGYTERYIGQLERGTKSPTLRTLADLAKAFSIELSTIIRSAERRHRNSGKR